MSYPLQAYLITTIGNDPVIKPVLGVQPSGRVSVYPFHHLDAIDPVYPIVTVSRFGDGVGNDTFINDPSIGPLMDFPKLAICVWDKRGMDVPWLVHRRIKALINGQILSNQYFTTYRVRNTLVRDDLFDETQSTYHLHSEYECWVRESTSPIPISANP